MAVTQLFGFATADLIFSSINYKVETYNLIQELIKGTLSYKFNSTFNLEKQKYISAISFIFER